MSCEDVRGHSSQTCHLWQPCSLIILTSLNMAIVDEFVTVVRPSVDTSTLLIRRIHPLGFTGSLGASRGESHPTRCSPHVSIGCFTAAWLCQSPRPRMARRTMEDYGSSGSGDVGRMELNGGPSWPPPGLTQDIGEVAKIYPVGQLASRGLPFLPSPRGFANKKITAPSPTTPHSPPPNSPPPLLRAPSRKGVPELQFRRHLPRLRPGEACRLRACPSLNRPQCEKHEENLQDWGRRTHSWSREWLEGSQVTPWQLRKG